MTEPTPLTNALYRMKSYRTLLATEKGDGPQSAAADLGILIAWIEYARPLLGAVTPQPAGDFIDQPDCEMTPEMKAWAKVVADKAAHPEEPSNS